MRSRISTSNKHSFSDSSVSSTVSLVVYSKWMEMNNNINDDTIMDTANLPQLSYTTPKEQNNHVSKMANSKNNTIEQCVLIKGLVLKTSSILKLPHVDDDDNIINIQLLYNLNSPMEPNLWDGSFHPISFYRSLEYLASDSKNIKDSLSFIAKYISNKQINPTKFNNIKDFKGISEIIWNLISSVYQSKWNSLIADKNSNTLRQKILLKFTPKVTLVSNKSNNTIGKQKYLSPHPCQISEEG